MTRLAALMLACLAFAAFAQEEAEPPKPEKKAAEMDELSTKLLAGWEKKEYHLGREGVKKASYTLILKVGGAMPMEAKAKYAWDGGQGQIEWDNPMIANSPGGKSTDQFDGAFKVDAFRAALAGAKLTAAMEEDGGARIKVVGKNEGGFKEMVFDAAGVMTGMTQTRKTQMGPVDVKLKATYRTVGGKYLRDTQKTETDFPGRGKIEDTTQYSYTEVAGFQVISEIKSERMAGGQVARTTSITFTDWKLNDEGGCGCGAACGCGCGDGCACGCGCDDGCGCDGDEEDG